jgi:deoxyribodipyrimidine photolyase-related protein
MELRQETDYVRHHIQKILTFFTAMRLFAKTLQNDGHQVVYLRISDPKNQQSLTKNLEKIIQQEDIRKFEYQLPDEYRLDRQLSKFCKNLDIPTEAYDTEHFLTQRNSLEDFFAGKKTYVMENFYRMMRKKYKILMDGDQPVGGQWNFDKENRKPYSEDNPIPAPVTFENDFRDILTEIKNAGIDYFGEVNPDTFYWPTTRKQALESLNYFKKKLLPYFGTYQDAMTEHSWSLFHSRLSFALNSKLLSPAEVIKQVIEHWKDNSKKITIAQTEGFIRQILGWREFMRGVYWAKMPEYENLNFFQHKKDLPDFYWSGKTKMNCMKKAIRQSLDYAYAHHIQRLMVTGNFALLAGIDPDAVDAWYLGIYIDAIQWVEITNTRGMSQFADGGIIGTKPYVSSANYIDKMSDYCNNCYYNNKRKHGQKACPFNSLYWNFYDRHRKKLENNPRIAMMYRTWDRMDANEKKQIIAQAKKYLSNMNSL